jgi:hypothetical protein
MMELTMRRFLFIAFVAGCGGSTSGDADNNTTDSNVTLNDEGVVVDTSMPPSGALPCDVEPILTAKCGSCHGATPQFGAPMSLTNASDLQRASVSNPSKRVYEMVKERINLPADAVGRMPQKPNAPLSASELATMNAWLSSGAPERTTDCPGPGMDTGVATDSMTTTDTGTTVDAPPSTLKCTPDINVRGATKWTMPKDTRDVYTCYGFDYPTSMKKHIIGIAPKVDNPKIVHHVLLMEHTASVSSTPFKCSEGSIATYRMLYGWAPGVGSYELPPEAGLPTADSGVTHFVVQIHYNNVLALGGEVDNSGFDLCSTTTLRPNDADIMAFGSRSFTINPKSKLDITASWATSTTVGDIRVIGAFPHMHQLGKQISTVVAHKAGGTSDLGKDLAFDFNNQFFQPLPNILVKQGDTVKTRCVWENPTDRTVTWGENTDDEMCFSFTMYYPKVKGLVWSWMLPSQFAKTEPTP